MTNVSAYWAGNNGMHIQGMLTNTAPDTNLSKSSKTKVKRLR